MENALREIGVEPTVITSPDSLRGAEPFTHSTCYILKLHGDYKDARILNTDEELSTYPDAYNTVLDRIFDEHGPVRTKASKTARRIFLYARRGSKRQDLHESVIVRLMRSIVATPTLKCRAMARMDWPSLSME